MDAQLARDERWRRGRRSRVVLAPRRWRQVREKFLTGDGGKKARSPGRARNKPVNHRAGKAGLPPLNLYARVRFFVHFCTRDRGCSAHPAFPAPSCSFRGCHRRKARAHRAARMRTHILSLFDNRIGNHPHVVPGKPTGRANARPMTGSARPGTHTALCLDRTRWLTHSSSS